jgi:hypothetical protein
VLPDRLGVSANVARCCASYIHALILLKNVSGTFVMYLSERASAAEIRAAEQARRNRHEIIKAL